MSANVVTVSTDRNKAMGRVNECNCLVTPVIGLSVEFACQNGGHSFFFRRRMVALRLRSQERALQPFCTTLRPVRNPVVRRPHLHTLAQGSRARRDYPASPL